jgi:hypothetical protein
MDYDLGHFGDIRKPSGETRYVFTTRNDGDIFINVDASSFEITPRGGRTPRLSDALLEWYLKNPARKL